MKKLYYLIVLTLILGLTLAGCTLLSNVGQVPATEQSGISYLTKGGTTEAEAEEVVLYAGQYENVGVVKVWNDTENLYVKYIVDDPWCLTETHLHVAVCIEDIPQTKKGNPIPGKFDYEGEHDCVTEYTYIIPLTLVPGDKLYIAAHAVVVDTSIEMEEIVVSRPGIDAYGPLDNYAGLGDTIWGLVKPAVATWNHPAWLPVTESPLMLGATWISTDTLVENPDINSWRWFHDEINIQGYPLAGSVVSATADNEDEVYLNGVLIGSDNNWPSINNYSISPQPGVNTLDFIVFNWAWGGGVYANPTGLIYKATINYYPEESAWAGEEPLPGDNWATYFTYTHDGCYILNITSVNNNTGYTHYFTISYDPVTDDFTGTGNSPHAGPQSLTDIELFGNEISFRSDYDNSTYYWFPAFILEDDGTLTFVPKEGDNVWDAQGYWEITYECNGE